MRQTFVPRFFNILHARILSRTRAKRRKIAPLETRDTPQNAPFPLFRTAPGDQWQRGTYSRAADKCGKNPDSGISLIRTDGKKFCKLRHPELLFRVFADTVRK